MADDTPGPPLLVTGTLPSYILGAAYSGALDVSGAVGRFTVEVLPESTLPSGAYVRADNLANKLTIRWDSYSVYNPVVPEPVYNGGFELGDDGVWVSDTGAWSNVAGQGKGGGRAAQFGAFKGTHNYVGLLTPVTDINRVVRLNCSINHGSASTGEVAAGPYLLWFNRDRQLLRWTNPGQYVRGGKSGDWHDYSFAEAAAGDANVKWVAPGLSANRKSSGAPLWADDVRWNHSYTMGTATGESYFVSLKVTDSLNRVAYWSGDIIVGLPVSFDDFFANGERGYWLDPSDLTTMFQDSAGTTPVTVPGHRVGLIMDKSGNGNHFTSSGTARPILRMDGDSKYYLEFDVTEGRYLALNNTTSQQVRTDSVMTLYGIKWDTVNSGSPQSQAYALGGPSSYGFYWYNMAPGMMYTAYRRWDGETILQTRELTDTASKHTMMHVISRNPLAEAPTGGSGQGYLNFRIDGTDSPLVTSHPTDNNHNLTPSGRTYIGCYGNDSDSGPYAGTFLGARLYGMVNRLVPLILKDEIEAMEEIMGNYI